MPLSLTFMVKIRCISTPDDCDRIFKLLDKIRPNNISFSRLLAITAEEYISNHKKDNSKISDYVNEDISSSIPLFFSDIESWKKVIEKLPLAEIKKIQVRHRQIDNILRKRIEAFL